MTHRTAFHLDCTAIFPACRFDCTKCMAEIQSTLAQTPGVAGLHTEGQGAGARLIIEHFAEIKKFVDENPRPEA